MLNKNAHFHATFNIIYNNQVMELESANVDR